MTTPLQSSLEDGGAGSSASLKEDVIEQIGEAILSMNHAKIFISTREKMHPCGIELFGTAIEGLEKALAAVQGMQ